MPFPKYQVTDVTYYIIRHTEKRRTQKIIKNIAMEYTKALFVPSAPL